MLTLTREQARRLDQWAIATLGIPGIILMENAGRGVADLLLSLDRKGPVVVCCGKGNNGGDGYVIARHLSPYLQVEALVFADRGQIDGDALIQLRILEKCKIPVQFLPTKRDFAATLAKANWVIDALFGTGLAGMPREPVASAIRAINRSNLPVLAVDIPSGLDADTGIPMGIAVRAAHTATFVAPKKGFSQAEASAYLGSVHVLPIGLPAWDLSGLGCGP